jgi:hypothetical protein
VADHDAGERGRLEHALEPLDSRQVQMVRRLIEQQNVRFLNQTFDDGQALAPPSR